ncbi:hypothetical protein EYF80_034579 [Liparis tanakae]|uniref:Uncharacterized protein n=1 Tax=Liparis tanakae TaxID=230148 RepID=A0A4Z2GP33_9TELE|nr:hypothetical protein EYF80_034579 [Liparis tanakae]
MPAPLAEQCSSEPVTDAHVSCFPGRGNTCSRRPWVARRDGARDEKVEKREMKVKRRNSESKKWKCEEASRRPPSAARYRRGLVSGNRSACRGAFGRRGREEEEQGNAVLLKRRSAPSSRRRTAFPISGNDGAES